MRDDLHAIESLVRQACEKSDFERAATLTVRHYGPELLGFLVSQLRDRESANDVFADFCERFWQTLPDFGWRCSVRTWSYKLARNAAADHQQRARRHARNEPLSHLTRLSAAIVRLRTATASYQRSEVKDRLQALRASLPLAEQELLVLRVDRGLSWLDLAEILSDDIDASSPERLKTRAALLRKRFQLAKEKLRHLATEAGLLET